MSSILTNNSAMVALQTLKSINSNLANTQNEISTGKSVSSAKDNSAVWAISKVMSSDVKGFEAISSSLALGESTVAVAQNGAETVADLLTEIKGKIVASQEGNVDRSKIQEDITALRGQIKSVVDGSQFNGLNLLSGGGDDMEILSSLDRSAGAVTASKINVDRQNLNGAMVIDQDATPAVLVTTAARNAGSTTAMAITAPTAGTAYSVELNTGTGSLAGKSDAGANDNLTAIAYIAMEGDTAADVATGLAAAFTAFAGKNGIATSELNITASGSDLSVVVGAGNSIQSGIKTIVGDNSAAGQLAAMDSIDVTTSEGAATALEDIEGLIQTTINAAASFGSDRGRIETQSEFVSKMTDSLKSGIGALVDADMEAASAKLQALQTQQQLGVQALSIANQAPQTILSLFR